MAKKRSRKKSIRHQTSFFKSGDAKTIEQYILALIITGIFSGAGTVIGSVIGKYLVKEADAKLPLPESLHAAINSA